MKNVFIFLLILYLPFIGKGQEYYFYEIQPEDSIAVYKLNGYHVRPTNSFELEVVNEILIQAFPNYIKLAGSESEFTFNPDGPFNPEELVMIKMGDSLQFMDSSYTYTLYYGRINEGAIDFYCYSAFFFLKDPESEDNYITMATIGYHTDSIEVYKNQLLFESDSLEILHFRYSLKQSENNVFIPDENFLAALIENGVDMNEDGQISYEEAEAVTNLRVNGNSISDLTGIESFINLDTLKCSGNQLTSLDISNNSAIVYLDLSNMPSLYRVCVWEMPFPPINVNLDTTGSPNVYFTTECTVGIEENNLSILSIFPNPTDGIITIDIYNPLNADIEIYNPNGKMIYSKPLQSSQEQIDLSSYPSGLYFVKVRQQGVLKVGKVVVR